MDRLTVLVRGVSMHEQNVCTTCLASLRKLDHCASIFRSSRLLPWCCVGWGGLIAGVVFARLVTWSTTVVVTTTVVVVGTTSVVIIGIAAAVTV